jgi:hypothetical protein
MKKFLAMLALLCSVTANAQGPDFPISFVKVVPTPEGMFTHKGNQVTWHSTIPGLSFCVAYSAAHGTTIAAHVQGHLYSEDITHCMTTDGDGNASDLLTVDRSTKAGKGLVLATIILAGDQYTTITIPVQKLQFDFYY